MIHSQAILLSCLLLAPALAAQGGDKISLAVQPKKGETAYFLEKSVMQQTIDMGGQQMETTSETNHTLAVTVTGTDDQGNLQVEVKVLRIHGSIGMPMGMGDVEFDSAKPPAVEDQEGAMPGMGGIGKAMTAFAGKTFTARVNTQGRVSDAKGVDEAIAEARKAAGGAGSQMLGGSLNASAVEQLIASAFGWLPTEPVAIGGEWERQSSDRAARMQIQTATKVTLVKSDTDQFELKLAGTISKAPGGAGGEAAGGGEEAAAANAMMAKMTIKNGKITGSQVVSRKDGFTVKSEHVTSMDMNMPGPMGGEMEIAQKTTRTVQRTTAEAAMPAKKTDKADGKD